MIPNCKQLKDIAMNTVNMKSCLITTETGTDIGSGLWYKFAEVELPALWDDSQIMFSVSGLYGDTSTRFGILRAYLRYELSSNQPHIVTNFRWLAIYNITADRFKMGSIITNNICYIKLFCFMRNLYDSYLFYVINESKRNLLGLNYWQLFSNNANTHTAPSYTELPSGYTYINSTIPT